MPINVSDRVEDLLGGASRRSLAMQVGIPLLIGDLIVMALHCIQWLTRFSPYGFMVGDDRGFGEIYQYAKLLTILAVLFVVFLDRRRPIYLAVMIVYACVLLDDALMIHETLDANVASRLALPHAFGLRPADLGQLAVTAVVGGSLLIQFGLAYLASEPRERKVGRIFLGLLILLGTCGVALDMLHAWIWRFGPLLELVEDGGEMIAVSLALAYAATLLPHKAAPEEPVKSGALGSTVSQGAGL